MHWLNFKKKTFQKNWKMKISMKILIKFVIFSDYPGLRAGLFFIQFSSRKSWKTRINSFNLARLDYINFSFQDFIGNHLNDWKPLNKYSSDFSCIVWHFEVSTFPEVTKNTLKFVPSGFQCFSRNLSFVCVATIFFLVDNNWLVDVRLENIYLKKISLIVLP